MMASAAAEREKRSRKLCSREAGVKKAPTPPSRRRFTSETVTKGEAEHTSSCGRGRQSRRLLYACLKAARADPAFSELSKEGQDANQPPSQQAPTR